MKTSSKNCIVVIAILLLLQVTTASAQQRVPNLEMKVGPTVLFVPQPCPTTDVVTLKFRNNGLTDPITVDWSSTYLEHPGECVADYTPKSGTVGPIPAQGFVAVDITLSFIGQCEGTTKIKFDGVIQGDPGDTHSDTLTVLCNEAALVPSHTNLGLLILVGLLLMSGLYVAYRRRQRVMDVQ